MIPQEIFRDKIVPMMGCLDHFTPMDGHMCTCKRRWRLLLDRGVSSRSNQAVICKWLCGMKGRSNNMHTDGFVLHSYNMVIGVTERDTNRKLVFKCTAHDDWFVSLTTSCHVNMGLDLGDGGLEYPSQELINDLFHHRFHKGFMSMKEWDLVFASVIRDYSCKEQEMKRLLKVVY